MCGNPFKWIGRVVGGIFGGGGGGGGEEELAAARAAAARARETAAPDPEAVRQQQILRLRRLLARQGQGRSFGGVGGAARVAVKRLLGAGGS